MRRKSTGKKIKTSTPSCQNWLLQSSEASPPTGCALREISPAHRDNKGEPWCAANPNQSLVQRHLGEVRPPERSGNRWRWFEERATRLLNPRNKRMRKNQDGNRTQNGETWRTDSWTYALWMDPYVSWERTTPNQDVSDPDIQSWLWRALLAWFMCLD